MFTKCSIYAWQILCSSLLYHKLFIFFIFFSFKLMHWPLTYIFILKFYKCNMEKKLIQGRE